jgi:hypothetical protein
VRAYEFVLRHQSTGRAVRVRSTEWFETVLPPEPIAGFDTGFPWEQHRAAIAQAIITLQKDGPFAVESVVLVPRP